MRRDCRECQYRPSRYDVQNNEGEGWRVVANTDGTASSCRALGRKSAHSR
jgi:hypothetical protein